AYAGKRVWLNFDGINWKADVFVNGTSVGSINGALTRAAFDVTANLTVGAANSLAVKIHKNDNPGDVRTKGLYTWGANGGVTGYDEPTFACSIAWNWIPTIRGRNIGIYDDVFLTSTQAVSIVDPFVKTE